MQSKNIRLAKEAISCLFATFQTSPNGSKAERKRTVQAFNSDSMMPDFRRNTVCFEETHRIFKFIRYIFLFSPFVFLLRYVSKSHKTGIWIRNCLPDFKQKPLLLILNALHKYTYRAYPQTESRKKKIRHSERLEKCK